MVGGLLNMENLLFRAFSHPICEKAEGKADFHVAVFRSGKRSETSGENYQVRDMVAHWDKEQAHLPLRAVRQKAGFPSFKRGNPAFYFATSRT
jgi:hypothetical protein